MRITIKLDLFAISFEQPGEWDASEDSLKFSFTGMSYQDKVFLAGVVGGRPHGLIGTNHPSCSYSVDITLPAHGDETITFKHFRYETLDSGDEFQVTGSYRDSDE